MDLAAQRTQPLMPAFASKTSSASGHKVRRTLGWKQPSGLARRELLTPTLSPSCNREPLATLMSGRPTKVTPRPSDTPLSGLQKPKILRMKPDPGLAQIRHTLPNHVLA